MENSLVKINELSTRPYQCKICRKRYRTARGLKIHFTVSKRLKTCEAPMNVNNKNDKLDEAKSLYYKARKNLINEIFTHLDETRSRLENNEFYAALCEVENARKYIDFLAIAPVESIDPMLLCDSCKIKHKIIKEIDNKQ